MKNFLTLFIAVIFSVSAIISQTENPLELTVEDIWSNHAFYGSGVSGFRSMNDGEHYTRFISVKGKKAIVKYSFSSINKKGDTILSSKDLVYNGKYLKVDDYEFNDDETKLLLTVNQQKRYRRSFYAEYFLFDLQTGRIIPLDLQRMPQTLASYSPDGKKVAYIYENNLYVKEINSGNVTQITKDGEENKIINGTTDWVYEEEFAITKAYDWSYNSDYIAFLRFDESQVKEFTMMYYNDLYPTSYIFKYPKAGEDNSKVSLYIYNLNKNGAVTVDLGNYEYIPRIKFSNIQNRLLALTLNRHQNHLQYHMINVDSQLSSKMIYEEKDDAYLDIDDNLLFLKDGKHFIRTSEKDGYNHIYKIGIDGSSKQITKGDWDVISFEGIDEEKGLIYYTAAAEGPQYSALYSININGKDNKKISIKKGTNSSSFSKGMKYFVNRWSNINTPQVYSLHKSDGTLIEVLEDNEFLREYIDEIGFQSKKFITVNGASTLLNAWILYPKDFDSTKKYPVYFDIYGGPGSNTVIDSYNGGNGAYHQLLAKNGYIVMSVDPMGTMYRGSKFKKSTYLQLGKLETEDLIAVAQDIKKWSFVDSHRIGVMGWSYGGYMSSLAITKGADEFSMAIAVAPVTNWRYYDNIYTERFMRTPQENPNGYDENSPINHVDKLKGKYLLVHGGGDDNVHVQNAMEMIKALVDSDKDFDVFIYPNKNHGIYGGNTRAHLFRMMLKFTLENL